MPLHKKTLWATLIASAALGAGAFLFWYYYYLPGTGPLANFRYLAADSAFAASIDVAALRNNSLVREAIRSQASPELAGDYAEFVRTTGFNFEHDLDSVALAVSGPPGARIVNAVLQGNFEREKLERYLARHRQFSGERSGTAVYGFTGQSGRVFRVAFRDGRLLFSNAPKPAAMEAMVDLAHRAAPSLRDRLAQLQVLEALPAQTPVWVSADMERAGTLIIPFGSGSEATSFTADLLRGSRMVLASARPGEQAVELQMLAEYTSGSEARRIARGLSGLRALLSALAARQRPGPPAPTDLSRALDQIQIGVEKNAAVVRWGVPNSLLELLLRGNTGKSP